MPTANTATITTARRIKQKFIASEVSEGGGVRIRRALPSAKLRHLTPFLMLDHFVDQAKNARAIPDHPHRGQEIVSYVLSGAVNHEDFLGNHGTIGPGELQFMTAGRGIMHAEQPRKADLQQDSPESIIEALQLWIDLPQDLRYTAPRYRDVKAKDVPVLTIDEDRVTVKVIAGESHGISSPNDLLYTPIWYLDISIKPGGHIQQPVPKGWNAFLYVLKGSISVGEESSRIERFHVAVFEKEGEYVEASVPEGAEEGRFILLAGMPLDQRIVHYGPFVLSDENEVHQAMVDFQMGKNGFEKALTWQSEISKGITY